MVKMSPPHSSATVDVNDDNVQRFKEAGWTEVKSGSPKPSESTAKKSTAKRSSSEK